MTRHDLSDSTLDALAQGRKDAEAAVTAYLSRSRLLAWQVAADREMPIRMTNASPPEMTETIDGVSFRIIDPGTRVGYTLSSSLEQYLSGSRGHYPAHDALLQFERHCRRAHRQWWDHPDGRPTCSELAWNVFWQRTSLLWAAEQAGISWPRAERLLIAAARWMRRTQGRWVAVMVASATHEPDSCHDCRLASDREFKAQHVRATCAQCRKREAA